MSHIILIGWLTLVTQSARATAPEINVSLEPRGIALGEAGKSRVGLSSALGNQGTLPEVEGLEFARTGRSSQDPPASGEVRENQSLVQLATATRAGTSTNPALKMGNGGHAGRSSPVMLRGTGSGSTPAAATDQDLTRPLAPAALGPAQAPSVNEQRPGPTPNLVESGGFVSALRRHPLLLWILSVYSVALAGFGAMAYSLHRRIRLVCAPPLLWASLAGRALRTDLATMADAVRRAEAGDFFDAARSALQERLAQQWGLPPEAVTLAEIKTRTNGDGADVRRIFEMAGQLPHRATRLSTADLAYWQIIVAKELRRLK